MATPAFSAPDPATAAAEVEDTRAALSDLQLVYHKTCDERAYGSYNDMCFQMMGQIRAYQRELAAEPRRKPPPASQVSPSGAGGREAAGGGPGRDPPRSGPAAPDSIPKGER